MKAIGALSLIADITSMFDTIRRCVCASGFFPKKGVIRNLGLRFNVANRTKMPVPTIKY